MMVERSGAWKVIYRMKYCRFKEIIIDSSLSSLCKRVGLTAVKCLLQLVLVLNWNLGFGGHRSNPVENETGCILY